MSYIVFSKEFQIDLQDIYRQADKYGWNKTHFGELQNLAERLIKYRPQARAGLEYIEQMIQDNSKYTSSYIEFYAESIKNYFNSSMYLHKSITNGILENGPIYNNDSDNDYDTDSE